MSKCIFAQKNNTNIYNSTPLALKSPYTNEQRRFVLLALLKLAWIENLLQY